MKKEQKKRLSIIAAVLCISVFLAGCGATSMLAGNIPGKTGTISQRIAMVIQDGNYAVAGFWTAVVVLIAFVIIVVMNLCAGRGKRR